MNHFSECSDAGWSVKVKQCHTHLIRSFNVSSSAVWITVRGTETVWLGSSVSGQIYWLILYCAAPPGRTKELR